MSTQKHRFYRKILHVENFTTKHNGITVPCSAVLWCTVDGQTSRNIKTNLIGIKVYVGSYKFSGVDARHPKNASISLKNPIDSKILKELHVFNENGMFYSMSGSLFSDAFSEAYRNYILGAESRCKGLKGIVSWFSGTEGTIRTSDGQTYRVHACNIQGAKTWYPETACMYLKQGKEVIFDLADMGTHLTASNVRGNVYFDAEKWAKLDQSKLAFKCDENGKATNGLFSEK